MKFSELDLHPELLEAISYMGFEETTPIQERTIPETLKGRDIIGCAQTGTGKTAAFVVPILHMLAQNEIDGIGALVIVPTRELAIQIDQQIQGLGYFISVNSLAVYGGGDGSDWETQKSALKQGADIIVATPGKLISHMNMGHIQFKGLRHLILDEADRMLDIGFQEDLLKIISHLPKDRQTLLFSATMPPKIRNFASKILKTPVEVTLALSKPAEGVLQASYLAHDGQKGELLNMLVHDQDYNSILVFSSTKQKVFQIVNGLKKAGHQVEGISSNLEQKEREEVLLRFRSKRTRVLVATDVLSRGIDIKDIDMVINYDVPNDAEDYVHRIGRTARAATSGLALTMINEDDMYKFHRIEQLIEKEVMKLPLPGDLGEGPEWNPSYRPNNFKSGGKRGGKKGKPGPKGGKGKSTQKKSGKKN